jgi:hypothetical protein
MMIETHSSSIYCCSFKHVNGLFVVGIVVVMVAVGPLPPPLPLPL